MRKMKRWMIGILMGMLILTNVQITLAEEGNVIYDEDAGEFIFAPGSEYSLTDLFPNFKNVMPGDSLSQNIVIKNDASRKVNIKVYMRSLGAHEDSEEFLSQLTLHVDQVSKTELFHAPADETAQLTDWVYLGELAPGGRVELAVSLDIPVTLDNQFKNLVGYLDWEFKVEEYPVESSTTPGTSTPGAPGTGDAAPFGSYCLMAVGAAAVLVYLGDRKRKSKVEIRP